jgi:hypothetical protein
MFRKQEAYPTYLFFNPYEEEKTVEFNIGKSRMDVYDSIARTFVQQGASGNIAFTIAADAARVLVLIPAGAQFSVENGILTAGDVPVDYRYEK